MWGDDWACMFWLTGRGELFEHMSSLSLLWFISQSIEQIVVNLCSLNLNYTRKGEFKKDCILFNYEKIYSLFQVMHYFERGFQFKKISCLFKWRNSQNGLWFKGSLYLFNLFSENIFHVVNFFDFVTCFYKIINTHFL